MCKKMFYLVSLVLVLSIAGNGWAGTSNPTPANGAVHTDTWANLGWEGAGASFDVYFGDNLDNVKDGTGDTFQGNQTTKFYVVGFPGFAFPDGLVPGTTYYWRIDETQADGTIHTGSIWSFSIPAKIATNPNPPDGTEFVGLNAELSWKEGFGAKLHTVYIGTSFDEVNNATGGSNQAAKTFSPKSLEAEKVYYWRVDEFDAIETYKGDVWSFTTVGAAGSPNPSNGAVDVSQAQILNWTPADTASSHQIYLGTDTDAVNSATTASPEYKGSKAAGDEILDPGKLDWETVYYWRVDAVYDADPGNPVKGLVWSFTTADFLVVDDFESYNDLNEDEPGSNRIYLAWVDGFANPAVNGALVGYENPPFAEQTIVRGGSQSMPYFYDNAVGNSEATLTLTSNRNWTENGVNTLIIYYRGNRTNAAEQMYVAVNGSAVVNNDNLNASQTGIWTAWNIDLQAFAGQGVDLTNVNTISIGFGDKSNPQAGGSGTIFFDDIRLSTAPAPVGRMLLFEEDFEVVELGTSPEESAGTEGVWTDTPPEGWFIDESGVPGIGNPDTDGVADWAGWAITDKDWWVGVAGDQRRVEFTLGQGAVAVADPDEWDDTAHTDSASAGWYKTFMSTPAIDISEAQAGTVQLKFDSSWRPEFDDNYHQTANITASFDGAEPIEVLLWESDAASPNFKDDNSTNETITLNLENPPWATSVVLTFGLFEAGNDWWWAIDNIQLTGSPK
ncbi:MAG: hypothetical protein H8D56_07770 [Planctomycetes bacterium]|nr:hypothetical protein [Planctomycetota bacterium]